MKSIFLFVTLTLLQTAGHYTTSSSNGSGTWALGNNHCHANKFLHHRESQTVWDTTQTPNPKFIIDFFHQDNITDGKFTMVQGQPKAPNQVSIGVGLLRNGALTFYSSTGGKGKEEVTVKIENGKPHVIGTGIELANQHNPADILPLTFDITIQ